MQTAVRRSPSEVVADAMTRAPVDVQALIGDLGMGLSFERLPASVAGKLVRDTVHPAGFRVVVNASDNPRRQRFTMAHECAHYVLHRDLIEDVLVDDVAYRSTLRDEFEREADRYAARLLLPGDAVRRAYRDGAKSYAALGTRFDVSNEAVRIRLKELGLAA